MTVLGRLSAQLRLRRLAASFSLGLSLLPHGAAGREAAGQGVDQVTAQIDGHPLRIYSYHPETCAAPAILIVFHGNSRAAKSYLNSSRQLADQSCFVVYAPLFDAKAFPSWSYQRGGLVEDGALLPEQDWTVEMAGDLVDWVRKQEGRPDAEVYLFGHSAGAQFLSRVAAYALPAGATRIVIANPSTYVLPSDEAVPYGFGGLPDDKAESWMKAYLAAPVTIYLGDEDVGSKELTMTAQAVEQGANRLDRGRRSYDEAKRVAETHGWPFNWRLVYAPGIGHSGRGMLQSKEAIRALGF